MDYKIDILVSDAFGGFGGISEYNRNLICAIAAIPQVSSVRVTPRIIQDKDFTCPEKVFVDATSANGTMRFLLQRAKAIHNHPPDLVICGHINLLPLSLLTSWRYQVPHVLQIHGIEAWNPTRRLLVDHCAKRLLNIFSVSKTTADRFQAWTGTNARTRYWIIPNTFADNRFYPGPKPPDLSVRYGVENSWVILTLGRLDSEKRGKGFDAVLDAMPKVLETIPNAIYIIAGDGPDTDRLRKKAQILGISQFVRFAGRVKDAELRDHYLLADVFAMPSRGEGFGIVLLEAMACGVPVIGSLLDGTKDALMNGKIGKLVNPDYPETLINALNESYHSGFSRNPPDALRNFNFYNFSSRVGEAILGVLESH